MVTYPKSSGGGAGAGGSPNPYALEQINGHSLDGNDGVGYGAGGGGAKGAHVNSERCFVALGGNSGQFKQGSFKLTSTSDIPITIG
jgi:hypothetical protein